MKINKNSIITSLITAGILSFASFAVNIFWIGKQNAFEIEHIQGNIEKISSNVERIQDLLITTRMFIVSMHPKESNMSMATANKLSRMNPDERDSISQAIGEYQTATEFYQGMADNSRMANVMESYSIDQNDLRNIWGITDDLRFNDSNKPNKFQRQIIKKE